MPNLLEQLDNLDYDQLAQQVEEAQKQTDDELYCTIGAALDDSGYSVPVSGDELIEPKMFNPRVEVFNFNQTQKFLGRSRRLSKKNAESEGKKYWERFKEQLKTEICESEFIGDIIKDGVKLKDILKKVIPVIAVAIGLSAINPILFGIIVATIALLLKVGIKTYCEI